MVRRSTGLVRHGVGAVDDQRVAEQLVGQPAEADGAGMDAGDDGALAVGVGLVGGELGLGADGGDRRAQLVRGVGDQVAHDLELPGLPRHEAVDRADERADLARGGDVERRQVARLAGGEPALDPAERRQRRADGERRERRHREPDRARRRGARCGRSRAASASRARVVWPTTTSTVPVKSRSEKRRG